MPAMPQVWSLRRKTSASEGKKCKFNKDSVPAGDVSLSLEDEQDCAGDADDSRSISSHGEECDDSEGIVEGDSEDCIDSDDFVEDDPDLEVEEEQSSRFSTSSSSSVSSYGTLWAKASERQRTCTPEVMAYKGVQYDIGNDCGELCTPDSFDSDLVRNLSYSDGYYSMDEETRDSFLDRGRPLQREVDAATRRNTNKRKQGSSSNRIPFSSPNNLPASYISKTDSGFSTTWTTTSLGGGLSSMTYEGNSGGVYEIPDCNIRKAEEQLDRANIMSSLFAKEWCIKGRGCNCHDTVTVDDILRLRYEKLKWETREDQRFHLAEVVKKFETIKSSA